MYWHRSSGFQQKYGKRRVKRLKQNRFLLQNKRLEQERKLMKSQLEKVGWLYLIGFWLIIFNMYSYKKTCSILVYFFPSFFDIFNVVNHNNRVIIIYNNTFILTFHFFDKNKRFFFLFHNFMPTFAPSLCI